MFNSEVQVYSSAALRSNLGLRSCPRTALCTRALHSMNTIRGCNEHLTPPAQPIGHLQTREPLLYHQIWGEVPSKPGKSQGRSWHQGRGSVPRLSWEGQMCWFHKINPRQLLSLLPHHQFLGRVFHCVLKNLTTVNHCKIQANLHHLTFPVDLLWVAHHSKLEFNNLGVEQLAFPLYFYPEYYQRETDNTIWHPVMHLKMIISSQFSLISSSVSLEMVYEAQLSNFSTPLSVMKH